MNTVHRAERKHSEFDENTRAWLKQHQSMGARDPIEIHIVFAWFLWILFVQQRIAIDTHSAHVYNRNGIALCRFCKTQTTAIDWNGIRDGWSVRSRNSTCVDDCRESWLVISGALSNGSLQCLLHSQKVPHRYGVERKTRRPPSAHPFFRVWSCFSIWFSSFFHVQFGEFRISCSIRRSIFAEYRINCRCVQFISSLLPFPLWLFSPLLF